MRIEIINGDKLKVYNSIDELPIERLHKFNKLLLIDSCVGSTADDINTHIEKAIRLIDLDVKSAKIELTNLSGLIYLINEKINPKLISFYVLVAEINDVPMTDISDENLNRLLKKYSNTKVGWLRNKVEALKKKLMSN